MNFIGVTSVNLLSKRIHVRQTDRHRVIIIVVVAMGENWSQYKSTTFKNISYSFTSLSHEILKFSKIRRMLSWYELFMMIISGISIPSQLYVIYLIRYQSPTQMDSYRPFIYMTTVSFPSIFPIIHNF